MVCFLVGLAFMNGPQAYLRKLTEPKNKTQTFVLIGSIILSLFFSIIYRSYLLSLFFCFIELNAVILFFCNTFPMGF